MIPTAYISVYRIYRYSIHKATKSNRKQPKQTTTTIQANKNRKKCGELFSTLEQHVGCINKMLVTKSNKYRICGTFVESYNKIKYCSGKKERDTRSHKSHMNSKQTRNIKTKYATALPQEVSANQSTIRVLVNDFDFTSTQAISLKKEIERYRKILNIFLRSIEHKI